MKSKYKLNSYSFDRESKGRVQELLTFIMVILATFILGHFVQSLVQACTCSGEKNMFVFFRKFYIHTPTKNEKKK